eukprot:TRINITY_DN4585_c0_g1_i3.p1 TRINITY_DN4585_c0_g1~~TRINITY_DN4585_c0_g1_i3.p1  ORF type:complete len:525 (-),score=125.96 TRINITY_DN4585_c0_g1_i3:103-1677(-)
MYIWGKVIATNEPIKSPMEIELTGITDACLGDGMHMVLSHGQLYSYGRGSTGSLGIGTCEDVHTYTKVIRVPAPLPTALPSLSHSQSRHSNFTPAAQISCVRSMGAVLVAPMLSLSEPKEQGKRKNLKDLIRTISSSNVDAGKTEERAQPGAVYIWGKGAYEYVFRDMVTDDLMPKPMQWPGLDMIKGIGFAGECIYMLQHVRYFGVDLEELMIHEAGDVPWLVEKVISVLENEDHLKTDGIFRMSGNMNEINAVIKLCDRGIEVQGLDHFSVHTLTGLLKRFLKSLPSPLIALEEREELQKHLALPIYRTVLMWKQYLRRLDSYNAAILRRLLPLLRKTLEFKAENQMGKDAIAICWSPIFFGDDFRVVAGAKRLAETLVEYGELWFTGTDVELVSRATKEWFKSDQQLVLDDLTMYLSHTQEELGVENASTITRKYPKKIINLLDGMELDNKDWTWIQVGEILAASLPPHLDAHAIVQILHRTWRVRTERNLSIAAIKASLVPRDDGQRLDLQELLGLLYLV